MGFALKRILLTIPLLLVVSLVVFFIGEALPGDPLSGLLEQHGGPEARAALEHELGLDKPVPVRYANYMTGLITEGDFGKSYVDRRPLGPEIYRRFGATFELTLAAILLSIPIGVVVGIISAARRGRWEDYAANVLAVGGISVPVFWLGMVLTMAAATLFDFSDVGGRYEKRRFFATFDDYQTSFYILESLIRGNWDVVGSCLRRLLLPAVALSTIPMAVITRMTRSAMLEEVGKDYVRTAHAKGLDGRTVVLRHVLRNALIPVVTITGLQFGALLSGAVLTESVFSWPGLGTFILDSVESNDSPALVGAVLLVASIFIAVNLTVDLAYGLIDPRVRQGGGQ